MSNILIFLRPIRYRAVLILLGLFLVQLSPVVLADDVQMSISPERCFGLNQGQKCYQNITIKWQADQINRYCLYQETGNSALICWEHEKSGQVKLEFESKETVTYQLVLERTGESVVESKVIVTWVYGKTKRRRTNWRLF